MPFIDKLLEWENDEVMGENGNCFGILERRQGKSRDGLPKLRRLQVVCIASFFFEGGTVSKSSQHIPSHCSRSHIKIQPGRICWTSKPPSP